MILILPYWDQFGLKLGAIDRHLSRAGILVISPGFGWKLSRSEGRKMSTAGPALPPRRQETVDDVPTDEPPVSHRWAELS